jgi:DNA-binding transcriptional ArsR family regulator
MWHAGRVSDALEALAEPHRRSILDRLRRGESSVGTLVREMGSSQPLISKHLRVLREAGLVDVRVDAQRRLYRVRPEGLMELDAWLEPYREMWHTSLDRLEAHLREGDAHE